MNGIGGGDEAERPKRKTFVIEVHEIEPEKREPIRPGEVETANGAPKTYAQRWHAWGHKWTAGIFVVTFVYAIASVAQTCATHTAMNVSRDTARTIERPWVMFDALPMNHDRLLIPAPGTTAPNGKWEKDPVHNWAGVNDMGLYLRNFGRGPAFDVECAGWATLVPEESDLIYGKDEALPEQIPTSGWVVLQRPRMLAPGDAIQAVFYFHRPPFEWQLEVGNRIHGWIRVHYLTQFGEGADTLICFRAKISGSREPLSVTECGNHEYAR